MSFNVGVFRDYMKKLAAEHKLIKHTELNPRFYELGLEQIVHGSLSDLPPYKEFIVILEPLEFTFRNEDPDFVKRVWGFGFVVAASCDHNNHKMRNEIETAAGDIGVQFLRRIYQELDYSFEGRTGSDENPFLELDEGSITAMYVGPILTNCYGVRFTAGIKDEVDLLTNDDVWL